VARPPDSPANAFDRLVKLAGEPFFSSFGLSGKGASLFCCESIIITRYQERIKKTIARQRERLAIKRKQRKKARREYPYSKTHWKSNP